MKEILITSSALILALLVLRRVFRGVVSRRLQYALWGLVLVRLLIPVSLLPAADFSVLTATAPVQQAVAQRVNQPLYFRPQGQVSREELVERNIDPVDVPTPQDLFVMGESDPDNRFSTNWLVRDPESGAVTRYAEMTVGPWDILDRVWKAGMALMGGFFLLSNTVFYWRLRKNRREWASTARPYEVKRKVYLVPEGTIPSPCLFGRSIYITPAVAEDSTKLRHVLAHESTHARHWDPVWSLLRCVCLTVYWFDPLVWVAAACSKTDCELACDESVLDTLGEAERIPYGQTLLSLIPVKRAGNPMIAATTMTAGKKQLKDRVTRIARKPRQLVAAALAVAVLAGVVSACTFTGGKGETTPEPGPSQGPAESTVRPLTGEELRWFNEEFFNHFNSVISYTYNIRNQFANPLNLYDRPEDIDLYELFYLEGRAPTAKELRAYGVEDESDLVCPVYVITAGEMEALLLEYTGLSLEDFDRESLGYEYVEAVDAYFNMHGDTNYCGDLDFVCGTREGDTVKLYHRGDSAGGGWYCVTLADRQAGGAAADGTEEESRYWFVSNAACERPVIPTPLPAWEPEAVISLKDLTPYEAPAVTVETHVGDFDNSYENRLENWDFDGRNVVVYRSTDGNIYAALRREDGAMDVFHTLSDEDFSLFFYNGLLGRDGFTVTYRPEVNIQLYPTDTDYYYFDENGTPALLARCHEECQVIDLDGDGQDELVTPWQLFFQREGVVYEARLDELIKEACPELTYWDYSLWDKYGKRLYVGGLSGEATWERYVYFDGKNLLIYKNEKPTVDHMVAGADEGVPEAVVAQAKGFVSGLKWDEKDGTFANANYHRSSEARYDDWRVDYFTGPYTYSYGGATVEAWQFNYEMHTTTPEEIVLAGGKYITEDNWVSPGYPGCDTLFFEVRDGEYHYLNYRMVQEGMNSYYVNGLVLQLMEESGVELSDGSTYAQLNFQKVLGHLTDPAVAGNEMRIQYDDGQEGGGAYLVDRQEGNGPYYLGQMKDNSVVWSLPQFPANQPTGPSVTLSSEDWYGTLRFWKDSGLVMYQEQNRDPRWFEVTYDGDPGQDVYAYRAVPYYWARCWFDEAEYQALEATLPMIPDEGEGQSYLNITQEWAEAHEGLMTRLSPGGSMTCTYVKVTGVGTLEDMPETWFPVDIVEYPHFAFTYNVAFVPENEDALNTLMAGNTGVYEGGAPGVPQGALEYSRQGSMYLVDGYWRCGEIGTG